MQDIQHCKIEIQQRPDGIHEFTWYIADEEAVDTWINFQFALYRETKPAKPLHFLHIIQSPKFPPFTYIVRQTRRLQVHFPHHPPTRSAMLFDTRFMAGFINTMATLLNTDKDKTYIFNDNNHADAIRWLLSDD